VKTMRRINRGSRGKNIQHGGFPSRHRPKYWFCGHKLMFWGTGKATQPAVAAEANSGTVRVESAPGILQDVV